MKGREVIFLGVSKHSGDELTDSWDDYWTEHMMSWKTSRGCEGQRDPWKPANQGPNAGRNRYSIREQSQQLLFWNSFFFLVFVYLVFFFTFYRGNLPPSWTPSFGVYIWEFFLLHRTSKFSKFWKANRRIPSANFQHPKAPTNHQFCWVLPGWNFFSLKRQQHFRRFSKNGTISSFKRKGSMMTFQWFYFFWCHICKFWDGIFGRNF